MKYRVGDLFKWVSDECHVPDAMGDVYVLVKDYALKEGEEDSYLEKEKDTYSLLTVYSSEGDYLPFSSELPYEVIEDRIDECLYRVGDIADINSCETVEFDDDYDDDDYSVEEDDSEYEEEKDEAKDILDLIERCVKYGTNCMNVVGCTKIYCEDCPFSYDSKFNEEHVGCASLSEEEIQKIARHYLENISK